MPLLGVLCFVSSNIKPPIVGSLSDDNTRWWVMSFLEGQWVEQQMLWKFSGWLMHFSRSQSVFWTHGQSQKSFCHKLSTRKVQPPTHCLPRKYDQIVSVLFHA